MDPVIQNYPAVPFGPDLMFCYEPGIVYQKDMSQSISYDDDYFENYVKLEPTEIAKKLNDFRVDFVLKYCDSVLDMGIGSGQFIKSCTFPAFGYDINPLGVRWLKERQIYVDPYEQVPENIRGFTLWDVLEHMPSPGKFLSLVKPGQFVFISLPTFANLLAVRRSKHFKKDEHYYYYSAQGLIRVLKDYGFELLEISDEETQIGREDILAFAFVKIPKSSGSDKQ